MKNSKEYENTQEFLDYVFKKQNKGVNDDESDCGINCSCNNDKCKCDDTGDELYSFKEKEFE